MRGVRAHFEARFEGKWFWLRAEISNINIHQRSGHCYIDLVEIENGKTKAQCRAMIWNRSMPGVRQELGEDFANILKKGTEVLCYSSLHFSEVYGLSVNISRIDKNFNLGNLEKKKQETLAYLKEKALLEKNRQIPLPTVIQHIAIIGSPNTSGYTDIMRQLEHNEYGYDFKISSFSSSVQGDGAEAKITQRLRELRGSAFDVIAIVRGGGSKLDLEVFNSVVIAEEIATHDKPIWTGIGHETDLSVVDVVANRHFKTPTALGSYLVERIVQFETRVESTYNYIREYYDRIMTREKNRIKLDSQVLQSTAISFTQIRRGELHKTVNRVLSIVQGLIAEQDTFLSTARQHIKILPKTAVDSKMRSIQELGRLIQAAAASGVAAEKSQLETLKKLFVNEVQAVLTREKRHLKSIEGIPMVYHPKNILNKGFGIPRRNGKLLTGENFPDKGEEIELELADATLILTYNKKKKQWMTSLMKKPQQS